MDLLARMKDYIQQPDRIVNVKNALEANVTRTSDGGLKIDAASEKHSVSEGVSKSNGEAASHL